MKEVKDFNIKKGMNIEELLNQYYLSGGFQGRHLAEAAFIVEEMIRDKQSTNFLSFPACIISTGVRGIIRDFLKYKWFNVVITTNGTLDHDLARLLKSYYLGSFYSDDYELAKEGILRLGNIFIPEENYGYTIERIVQDFLEELKGGKISSYEFVWELGKYIDKNFENKEDSIIYWAYKNKIPVIIPGFYDGAVGYQVWYYRQKTGKEIVIDLAKDEDLLNSIIFDSKKSGALIIGGGISKHHTIWWNQFKNGLDYSVYITTAVEYDGSLSGAQTREAITWKKISQKAKHITLYSDATIALPIIHFYLVSKLG